MITEDNRQAENVVNDLLEPKWYGKQLRVHFLFLFCTTHNVKLRGHLALNSVFTEMQQKKKIKIAFSVLFLYKRERRKKNCLYRPTYSNYDVLFK